MFVTVAAQRKRTLFSNCTCVSECGYSLDSIYTAWCTTTVVNPAPSQECCGKYSVRMSVCWEECALTVSVRTTVEPHTWPPLQATAPPPPPVTQTSPRPALSDLPSMWGTITTSAVGGVMIAYFLAGVMASCLTGARRTLGWLPCAASCLGGCQSFVAASLFSVIASFIYLSLPYAIDFSVGICLGVCVAAMFVYGSLGRQYGRLEVKVRLEDDD